MLNEAVSEIRSVHALGGKILLPSHAAEAPLKPLAQLLPCRVAPVDTAAAAAGLIPTGHPEAG